MGLDSFVHAIAEEFDGEDITTFHPDVYFKELAGWGSMRALLVIAKVEDLYNVTLSAEDIKGASTLRNIYDMIMERQSV